MNPSTEPASPAAWHARFLNQANWTRQLRRYLLTNIAKDQVKCALDIGCGTGALFTDMHELLPDTNLIGLDINPRYIHFASETTTEVQFATGDASYLPFASSSIDLAYFHYFLLWISTPARVLAEMMRILRPGGWLLAFAEPDYGGRIDYPGTLLDLGQLQNRALEIQGANLHAGRRLVSQIQAAGFTDIQAGILGNEWQPDQYGFNLESEWWVMQRDLELLVDTEEAEQYLQLDRASWENGERVLFIPTFYAAAVKPQAEGHNRQP